MDDLPGTEPTAHGVVWHHTSAEGLLGIVRQRELWASSSLSLNDSTEMRYGAELLADEWAKLRSSLASTADGPSVSVLDSLLNGERAFHENWDVYFICATAERDSLNQWMHYSHAQGYAIGLRTVTNYGAVVAGDRPTTEGPLPASYVDGGWSDVIYDLKAQREVVRNALAFYASHPAPNVAVTQSVIAVRLVELVTRLKHPAFAAEKEVRFITGRTEGDQELFRPGSRGLIPYLRIRRPPSGHIAFESEEPAPLPVEEVICGPTNSEDAVVVRRSVERLLAANGLGDVPVSSSTIPYSF